MKLKSLNFKGNIFSSPFPGVSYNINTVYAPFSKEMERITDSK